MLEHLSEWVQSLIESGGAVGVFALIVAENLFPPIPSEIILPFAGFLVADGRANFFILVAVATAGSTAGSLILYQVARVFGEDRVVRLVRRFGRWFGVSEDGLARSSGAFERHGAAIVLFGRCVPLVRSLISLPAGWHRMPVVRCTIATALGGALWNTALIGAGMALGYQWTRVEPVVGWFQWIVIAGIVILAAGGIWRRLT